MTTAFQSNAFQNNAFQIDEAPVVEAVTPGGGDSTRLRRRRRGKRTWRYYWEKDKPEQILVLKPEEAVLEPVVVEALWEEQAVLNDYIIEMSVARVSRQVLAKLEEVKQHLQARVDAETARKRRRKKALFLLLGGD